MENRNIIIALLLIVVVLAIVAGVIFTQTMNAKEPTKLKITSNNTLNEGDNLTLQLTDLNRTPLSNQKVNITVKDSNGKTAVNKTVETNSNGTAKLDLDLKKGMYTVNVTYDGNENYAANNTAQKLTVNEAHTESVSEYSSNSYPRYNPAFGSYRTVETHDELALIETASGQMYVLGGDEYYTYGGRDSQGHIELGSFVGKY
ncbi:hypothetical protein [Methanobrevibacter sp.]|uniref:Ig-like domain repeat protein n=1 Tax=Methanobrevibacter sp. TaxID=66852 RepID=UPI0026E05EC3|nr:hypothetical protein [Methanobrevibacter sp.]MDO5859872.1 hypothetical protein [Methanobrevibacter sp.]